MVATTSRSADELAAPLDLLLTTSAVGMADRLMPNVAWSRFALNLAKQPRTVAARAASLWSGIVVDRRGPFGAGPGEGRQEIRGPGMAGQSAAPPHDAGLLGDDRTLWINSFRTRTSNGVTPSGFDSCWISLPKGSHRATTLC